MPISPFRFRTEPVDSPRPGIHWTEAGKDFSVLWRSERGAPPPKRVTLADDTTTADTAYRLACEGTALLWRGDFHNATQLLQAVARRADKTPARKQRKTAKESAQAVSPADIFHQYRQAQSQRARVLGMLLLPFNADYGIALRRAPDARQACEEAWGQVDTAAGPSVASLRELLGIIGAHEWRKKGVEIPALGDPPNNRIHPHYGVFSPVRGEYVNLVAAAPLPLTGQVQVVCADLFPEGRASLVVCNPPWLPARPGSPIESAVYDEDSRMLLGFLSGLTAHLVPSGEGWLILSDFAEHLGLRSRADLLAAFESGGLKVVGRIDAKPRHPKASDASDPLHEARAAEVTSLWRLAAIES